MIYIIIYLIAIIAANLTVGIFGPWVSIVNAFLFIGLDLTARDALHDKWHNNHLVRNMASLIATGSILSWILNKGAGQIALASFLSFALAVTVDTIVYGLLNDYPKMIKINGSNIPSAAVDSISFPLLAFGWPPLIPIMIGQFLAKVLGGAMWSIVLMKLTFTREPQRQ